MPEDFVALARIGAPHGVRGEVKLHSSATPPEAVFSYNLQLESGTPITLSRIGGMDNAYICRIDGITDRNAAERLKGALVGVARSLLPAATDQEMLVADLIGAAVYDTERRPIGTVRDVVNYGATDILVMDTMDGELMLPFTQSYFPEMDLAARVLMCDMPDVLREDPAKDSA